MKFLLLVLPCYLAITSCATLPDPANSNRSPSQPEAIAILKKSARVHSVPWKRFSEVKVSYDVKWSPLTTRLQPVLTDTDFRKSSVETYRPAQRRMSQIHRGPGGTKSVERNGDSITVTYNGKPAENPEQRDAAALVADAYTIFLFGSSWLSENAENLQLLPSRTLNGESCHLISGSLKPGIGASSEDHFIAWISKDSSLLKRFQFTLNGLQSTRGADVEVKFSEMKTAPGRTIWPTRFIERIQRPLNIKAHEWRMTSLSLNGKTID
jgi:hypothetical protein